MSLLMIEGLVSGYGKVPVLHEVSMEVRDNEIVALIGPNGAGKTSLVKAVFGLLPASRGKVAFGNTDLTGLKASARRHLGMALIPQMGGTFPDLSIDDCLRVSYSSLERTESLRALDRAYEMFPVLAQRRRQLARTLSGGERQMLTFVSGLGGSPQFLALDEPTSGLAPTIIRGLMESIVEYKKGGCAILLVVEENPLELLPYVDRVYVMRAGTVQTEMAPAEILEDQNLQAAFFGTDS